MKHLLVILNLRQENKTFVINDQSNGNYDEGNEIICNTEVLRSNLCDCDDA